MSVAADVADGATSAGFWDVHLGHVLMLGGWVAVVGVVWLRERWRASRPDPADVGPETAQLPRSPWLYAAVAASLMAAAVHLLVIGEHFEESALYGWFFLLLTLAQLGWAAGLVARPRTSLLASGAAASVLVVLLWLATRTIAIPVGAAAGEREPFGPLDTVASSAELLLALFACLALYSARHHGPTTTNAFEDRLSGHLLQP